MIREDQFVPPSGCLHCGVERRDHFRRWTATAGWHKWIAPTDGQRLERMQARRAHRLAAKRALLDPDVQAQCTAIAHQLIQQFEEAAS